MARNSSRRWELTQEAGVFNLLEERGDKEPRKDFKQGAYQWTSGDGKVFVPAGMTIKDLAPGLYDVAVSQDGGTYFCKMDIKAEELLVLPDTVIEQVVKEITGFWGKQGTFAKAGLVHKRGILLYGSAGAGKSCAIRLALKDVIARGGVGINFTGPETFVACVRTLRNIQPNTPLVVVMEDLDAVVERFGESRILNILDGVEAIEHSVFLASTNFPQKLGARFVNRPSRFDKRFEFKEPSPAARRKYLEHISRGFDINVDRYTNDTEGLSFAHIRELFVATVLLDDPYEEAVATIKSMRKIISSDTPKGGEMGFRSPELESLPVEE